jgi:NTP pyrophosphatase (non-canonical NTP hydrolase)
MKKELQDYIKNLSLKDKKTLSEKALKVCEETGELARVVLPYDGANGTTHRFVEKNKILEETIDVILSSISIAYELGYSHEEIQEMMWRKAQKWHGIQSKEEKVEYPIPYEIHVTVNLLDNECQKEIFKDVCKKIGVKPIVIDLENKGEIVMQDVMTSSHIITDNAGAYEECLRIESELERNGFVVVRKKIETVPWHPAAPQKLGEAMPENCYFEAHIGCIISSNQKQELKEIAESFGGHLSKNAFKKLEDGKFINMLTMRDGKCTLETFNVSVDTMKRVLDDCNIQYEKTIIEFAIYDTLINHDFIWTK